MTARFAPSGQQALLPSAELVIRLCCKTCQLPLHEADRRVACYQARLQSSLVQCRSKGVLSRLPERSAMNFLQRLTSKSAAPEDAYGSVATAEDTTATSSPYVDSLQDADNLKFQPSSTSPAVVIRDKLTGSPFLPDASTADNPASPAIKSSKNSSGQLHKWA